jgi:hypothetical protein
MGRSRLRRIRSGQCWTASAGIGRVEIGWAYPWARIRTAVGAEQRPLLLDERAFNPMDGHRAVRMIILQNARRGFSGW